MKPFYPSNSTEGIQFDSLWCEKCDRDRAYREDPLKEKSCRYLRDAMIYDCKTEGYKHQWFYDKSDQPFCAAFIPIKTEEEKEQEAALQDRLRLEEAGQLRLFT